MSLKIASMTYQLSLRMIDIIYAGYNTAFVWITYTGRSL